MISYISNFKRGRNIPASSVFSTWRNAYQKIGDFRKKLKGNLSIFVNDRGGEFKKEIEGFNTAAKNGVNGIKDYLIAYNDFMKNDDVMYVSEHRGSYSNTEELNDFNGNNFEPILK